MRKSRPQLLAEFTKLLFERDPMGICFADNPDKETEYDAEALSILSRFVEGHLVEMSHEDASHVAYHVVQSAFTFWFNAPLVDEGKTKKLSDELLALYVASYPEQNASPEVGSADEESGSDRSSGLPGIAPSEASPGTG